MKIAFAVLACTFLSTVNAVGFNSTSLEGKLRTGTRANPNDDLTYIVAVKRLLLLKCTGILVTARIVVTIAKCISDLKLEIDRIWIPNLFRNFTYRILKTDIFRGDDQSISVNDIGLLLIKTRITDIIHLSYATLPRIPQILSSRTHANVLGYKNSINFNSFSPVLKNDSVKVTGETACLIRYEKHFKIKTYHICANNENDVHKTDPGDVLHFRGMAIGIRAIHLRGNPAVYVNLSERLTYIQTAKELLLKNSGILKYESPNTEMNVESIIGSTSTAIPDEKSSNSNQTSSCSEI